MKKMCKKVALMVLASMILVSSLCALIACDKTPDKEFVKENVQYRLNPYKTSVWGFPVGTMMNNEETYLKLNNNGQLELKIMMSEDIVDFAFDYLSELDEDSDFSLENVDLNHFVEHYAKPFFPGFDLKDIPNSLKLVEKSMGMQVLGIDFNNPKISALVNYVEENAKIPNTIDLPDNLNVGLIYKNIYEYKTLKDVDDNDYKALYVGDYDENGQPYFVLTQTDEEDVSTISIDIEFVKLHAEFVLEK